MLDLDPTMIVLGTIFSSIGFVAYRYGRRMEVVPPIVIGVAFAPDGQIASQPVVVQQIGITPETAPYAGQMAEAAIAAVLRCAPLNLPAQYYQGGWDEFVLTFSPKGLA